MFNIFIVLVLTFAVALVLIYFISAHDRSLRKKKSARRREEEAHLPPAINFRQFSKICMDVCENLKLEIDDITQAGSDEIVIHASTQQPITKVNFLIAGYHLHCDDTLENGKVMGVSEQIVSERLSKAIIITTGRINPAVKGLPELAPMEFVDGARLNELIGQYKINF